MHSNAVKKNAVLLFDPPETAGPREFADSVQLQLPVPDLRFLETAVYIHAANDGRPGRAYR